jgi:hypothetical protein
MAMPSTSRWPARDATGSLDQNLDTKNPSVTEFVQRTPAELRDACQRVFASVAAELTQTRRFLNRCN